MSLELEYFKFNDYLYSKNKMAKYRIILKILQNVKIRVFLG